jgi:hypothetical protein
LFAVIFEKRAEYGFAGWPRRAQPFVLGVCVMEMNWSRWFRIDSSFGLLLTPSQPGVFALAEEIAPTAPGGRRVLAVFEVAEAEDLALALSRMFAVRSPWREKLLQGRCFARYAVEPSSADRRVAASALRHWLESQGEAALPVFDSIKLSAAEVAQSQVAATVAERAVDRVTEEYAKAAGA